MVLDTLEWDTVMEEAGLLPTTLQGALLSYIHPAHH